MPLYHTLHLSAILIKVAYQSTQLTVCLEILFYDVCEGKQAVIAAAAPQCSSGTSEKELLPSHHVQ